MTKLIEVSDWKFKELCFVHQLKSNDALRIAIENSNRGFIGTPPNLPLSLCYTSKPGLIACFHLEVVPRSVIRSIFSKNGKDQFYFRLVLSRQYVHPKKVSVEDEPLLEAFLNTNLKK